MKIPKNLTAWQKKYGPGFVMCSPNSGRVIVFASDYRSLIRKARMKRGVHSTDTTVIYLPDAKSVSIFHFSV